MRHSENQLDAFAQIDLTKRESEVLNALKGEMTANEIAQELKWPINRVTGRINSLRYEKHRIIASRTSKETGYKRDKYRIRKHDEAPDVRPLSKEQKYEQCLLNILANTKDIEIVREINKTLFT